MLHTKGIVFRTIKYGETSVITDIYTEERGLQGFIAGGVRTTKSKMHSNLFQAMQPVEIVSYFKENTKSLHRIKEIRPYIVYKSIPFDFKKGAVSLFFAEVCRKSIQTAEADTGLYYFLEEMLSFLDSTAEPIHNIYLYFLLGLSEHLGFQPVATDEDDVFLDLREGLFTAQKPTHADIADLATSQHIIQLLQTPLENTHLLPVSAAERKTILDKLLGLFRCHVPNFGDINTTEVMGIILQ